MADKFPRMRREVAQITFTGRFDFNTSSATMINGSVLPERLSGSPDSSSNIIPDHEWA
jgi:hypothetical protein